MRNIGKITLIAHIGLLAACGQKADKQETAPATNQADSSGLPSGSQGSLISPGGNVLGTLEASESPAGVSLKIDARGLQPGVHGFHVHAVGKCEGPTFETAGAHWNPGDKKHGAQNPQGPHRGDLQNVTVGDDGLLKTTATLNGATLAELRDADGAALVLHMNPDDYKTDPSGSSGDRIACAVISSPTSS